MAIPNQSEYRGYGIRISLSRSEMLWVPSLWCGVVINPVGDAAGWVSEYCGPGAKQRAYNAARKIIDELEDTPDADR